MRLWSCRPPRSPCNASSSNATCPRLADALRPSLTREPVFAILKGRRNYLCLHRLQAGAPDDPEEVLFDARTVSAVGRQVRRLHEWAETTATGDRDELVPGVDDRAWRQVAVSARECLGTRCPMRTDCFAERARDEAGAADIVVTNHALLAIDAIEDFHVLPEHDVVIIDEAHDLVDRVTSVATRGIERVDGGHGGQALRRLIGQAGRRPACADRLGAAGEGLALVLADMPGGRIDVLPEALAASLAVARDAAHECASELRVVLGRSEDDPEALAVGRAALTAVEEVHDTSARLLQSFDPDIAARREVVWLDRPYAEDSRRPPALRVAPLDVGAMLADRLFGRHTVVLTSATLALGGSFEPLARQWGLPPPPARGSGVTPRPAERQIVPNGCAGPGRPHLRGPGCRGPAPTGLCCGAAGAGCRGARGAAVGTGQYSPNGSAAEPGAAAGALIAPGGRRRWPGDAARSGRHGRCRGGAGGGWIPGRGHRQRALDESSTGDGEGKRMAALAWSGIDVGSPFDHPRSGILYVARHLPPPGRDGLPEAYLTELCELIVAAGGRTLGLFSSMRAARQAADELRDRSATRCYARVTTRPRS